MGYPSLQRINGLKTDLEGRTFRLLPIPMDWCAANGSVGVGRRRIRMKFGKGSQVNPDELSWNAFITPLRVANVKVWAPRQFPTKAAVGRQARTRVAGFLAGGACRH